MRFCISLLGGLAFHALSLGGPSGVSAQGASFTPLGDLPGGEFKSAALDISADGTTVVGQGTWGSTSVFLREQEAFRWTATTGMVALGDLSGEPFSSGASGVSRDGAVVVGSGYRSDASNSGFRWTDEGVTLVAPRDRWTAASDVSADGSVVVGQHRNPDTLNFEVYRWTAATGVVGLGVLPGAPESRAGSVSADGHVVAGYSGVYLGAVEAFRWTAVTGMVGLGDLPGGDFSSQAFDISADGAVIVGTSASANGSEAFRWTTATGMVGLGDLPGGDFRSVAFAASADGAVIVGRGTSANGPEAFRWSPTDGMQSIQELLEQQGVDLTGWQLASAAGVSADGTTLVGTAINPDGNQEAFVATLPLPANDCTPQTVEFLHDEAVDGDLPNNSADTDLGSLEPGIHVVRGRVEWREVNGVMSRDFDGFNVRVAAGSEITSIVVEVQGFSGGADAAAILGSSTLGVGTNVLVNGDGVTEFIGGATFSDPIGENVTMNAQVTAPSGIVAGDGYDYEWRFTVDGCVSAPTNLAPTANAGSDQSIRAGDTVVLDGASSFDDNTASADLGYAWTLSSAPAGSSAVLANATTATPSLTTDLVGDYVLELIVTDTEGLSSTPDEVLISTNNLAPTANAGMDQLVILGESTLLSGSGSSDPDGDPLGYQWSVVSAPAGSLAVPVDPSAAMTTFTPDALGIYEIELEVNDFVGPGTTDGVTITVATPEDVAQVEIVETSEFIVDLSSIQVTTTGNQNALTNFLSQATVAIQEGDYETARQKLEQAIERTDGCVLSGSPDAGGPEMDWITDCAAQAQVYADLQAALALFSP